MNTPSTVEEAHPGGEEDRQDQDRIPGQCRGRAGGEHRQRYLGGGVETQTHEQADRVNVSLVLGKSWVIPTYSAFVTSSRLRTVALTVVALSGLAACGTAGVDSAPSSTPAPASSTASPSRLLGADEFAAAIDEPARTTINVHVPFEGTLAGTDLMIPYDQIAQQTARLPTDRRLPLAIYCMTDSMSADAARSLAALGYTDIVELDDGMRAWQAEGRPVSQTRPRG